MLDTSVHTPPPKRSGPIIDCALEIQHLAVEWLWRFWLANGKLHLLVGEPGSGKTTLLAEILSAFSTGGLLPDRTHAMRVSCLYWTAEDSIEETVMPRFIAAGANLRNIFVLRGMREHGKRRYFRPSDMPELVSEIKRLRQTGVHIGVVALDPLPSGSGNTNNNDAVRISLEPLIQLAEQEGLAIIGVRHLAKASSKKKLADRPNGSVAYLAASRVVLFVSRILGTGTTRDNPTRGVLVRAKSNLGPTDGGHAFTINSVRLEAENGIADTTNLNWDAEDLIGDPESIVRSAESNSVSEAELAAEMEFIRDLLAGGPVPANEAISSGQAQGFSPENLRKALREVGGNSKKESGHSRGAWYWALPGADPRDLRDRPREAHYQRRHDHRRNAGEDARLRDQYPPRHPRDEGRFDDIYEVEKYENVEKHDKHGNMDGPSRLWAGERNLPDLADSAPQESVPFWKAEINLPD